MRRWLREPLVHFLLLGAGLFLLFSIVGDSDDMPTGSIVVSAGKVAQLKEVFTRTWQRPPTEEELDGVIEDHIREEVYYREALAMGLDRDDHDSGGLSSGSPGSSPVRPAITARIRRAIRVLAVLGFALWLLLVVAIDGRVRPATPGFARRGWRFA